MPRREVSYVLALDQGTTSSRAILFDARGRLVASGQRAIRQIYPRPGWVEHDPEDIWSSQIEAASDCLRQVNIKPEDVAAIGIANQRETTLLWERATGRPVHNAIVWQCRRTSEMCCQLKTTIGETWFRERTGLLLDPYFSGTKLRWLLDSIPNARSRAERGELAFGTVDSWLLWRLTGGRVHATDPSNASRTLLYNLHRGDWDEEVLDALDVPRELLPEIRDSSGGFGCTDPTVFGAAISVGGVIGDQQAALFGQGGFMPGIAKNTYGTGSFALMAIGSAPILSGRRLLTSVGWQIDGRREYVLEGSVFVAGAVVQWLRDELGIIKEAGECEALAWSLPNNGGVYLVPAFVGLGAPHWDPYARGTIVGLTRDSGRAHLARAALEGIAFQTHDVLEAVRAEAPHPLTALRVDGGAAANNFLMQFQADLLRVPVERPVVTETTALGAAALAGLATGVWSSPEELKSTWQLDRRFEPSVDQAERDRLLGDWRRAVARACHWIE